MPREVTCPKCDADISDTHQEYDPEVGILRGGWYCEACDQFVGDDEYEFDWDR